MPDLKFHTLAWLLALAAVTPAAAAPAYSSRPLAPRQPAPQGEKPFRRLDPAECGVTVPNVYSDPRMWGDRFREFTLGALESGVAVADFDRDGYPDIFAVSKNGACALYRQNIAGRFQEVAAVAGVNAGAEDPVGKTGATAVDINQDGWPDIYLCRFGAPNRLYINNGDGTFSERAQECGLAVNDASVHAIFADYDRDGDLDLYLTTNILDFSKSPQGRRDYLFRNDSTAAAPRFTDVTAESGIWGLTQGHAAIWFDANHDGWPDLYVANDFETPDRFYLNRGDGTFTDVVDERLPHVTYFSMGADSGDLDNDGLVDFIVADMRERTHAGYMIGMEEAGRGLWELERVPDLIPQYMWSAVYINTARDRFLEVAHLTGLEATGWTWAPRFADLDNDGRLDAFMTAGMIRNFLDADLVDRQNVAPSLPARAAVWKNAPLRRETTLAFHNRGDLRFDDVSSAWGLDELSVSFGCAVADLDNDGDLDLVYANCDAPPTVVRNDTATGHRIVLKLDGKAPNRDALGAEIRLGSGSGPQVRQLFTERGTVASEPPLVHFGLGEATVVDRLTIRWPRGQIQVLEDLPADQHYTIAEPEVPAGFAPAPAVFETAPRPDAVFVESARQVGLDLTNEQRPFDELTRQRLLPRRLNAAGPGLAAADVDGDGLTDIFVTGTSGLAGTLFLGRPDGTWARAASQPWADAAEANDVAALFTDVNGDTRPDLVVASGGVEREPGDPLLDDRIYLNDARGRFSPAPAGTLPGDGESTGALAAADFDGDAAPDLFIGGRAVPGRYPATPRSFLYRNAGGRFVDVTDELAPGLRAVGMVTAAAWGDVDLDGRPDLVLALEWGPVAVWRNTATGFEDIGASSGLAPITGWWSGLALTDVDGDGRPDIVAGNVGLNTKYRASPAEPAVLFAGDFDGSGREPIVEAHYADGKLRPVRGRSKLAYVFPWLPRKFRTFEEFAHATVDDIFGADRLAGVRKLTATELRSGVFLNRADGRFEFRPLPRAAQIAPINAIVPLDANRDGRPDLVCVGNNFGPEPNTGRFDGGVGVLLLGSGSGDFSALPSDRSGLVVPRDARAALAVERPGGPRAVVVCQNNGPVLFFAPSPQGTSAP